MCGRFTLTTDDLEAVAREIEAELAPGETAVHRPRYNIAPAQRHYLVRRKEDARRELVPAMWGFCRPRSGDASRPVINARVETASQRPMFREAFAVRRCLVPADGFLEWTGPARARLPVWFHRQGGGLIWMAGLFDDDAHGLAFTILTTDASPDVALVHDRMPVLVTVEHAGAWLAEGRTGAPSPGGLLVGTKVSSRVNSAVHDDPACLEPASDPPPEPPVGKTRQRRLF